MNIMYQLNRVTWSYIINCKTTDSSIRCRLSRKRTDMIYSEILSIIIKWEWEVGGKLIFSQIVFHTTYFVPGNIIELGCNNEQVLTMKVTTFAWTGDYKVQA